MKFLLPIQKQQYGPAKDLFCAKCLTHERHFEGGGSWSPDLCPCGCEDTIIWHKMSLSQKFIAQKVYWENEEKIKDIQDG